MADHDVVPMPETAEAFYLRMRGGELLGLMNSMALATRREPKELNARLDALAEPLVHELHDGAEDYDEYIIALLYASALLAMTAIGQLEVDSQMWQLGEIDGPDDLGAVE